jgi:hypothetical protein
VTKYPVTRVHRISVQRSASSDRASRDQKFTPPFGVWHGEARFRDPSEETLAGFVMRDDAADNLGHRLGGFSNARSQLSKSASSARVIARLNGEHRTVRSGAEICLQGLRPSGGPTSVRARTHGNRGKTKTGHRQMRTSPQKRGLGDAAMHRCFALVFAAVTLGGCAAAAPDRAIK